MTSMQITIKYCAIAFAFFIIIQISTAIVFGIASIANIFDYKELDNNGTDVDIIKETSALLIDLKSTSLTIKNGDKLMVSSESEYIDINQIENKLSIVERKHNTLSDETSELILYVPENVMFELVNITAGARNINVESLYTKKLTLDIGAGNVLIKKLNVQNRADINGGIGKLTINDGNINNLDIKLGVGEATIVANLTGESDIETGIGKVKLDLLGNKNDYKIDVDKAIGSILIDGNDALDDSSFGNGFNTIDIEGGIGSIEVNFITNR